MGAPSFRVRSSARVAELADAVDSKSTDESLVGSTPTPGTSLPIGNRVDVLPDSCHESTEVGPIDMTKSGKPRKALKLSARATRLGIRVRKVPNRSRGEVYGYSWLVIVPAKVTGGQRLRKQYKATESREAVDFAEGEANKAREQGQTAFYLTPEQVTDARKAQGILEGLGLSLSEAATFAAKHLRPEGGDKTLAEVRDILLEVKKSKNLRPASYTSLQKYVGKLVRHLGDDMLVKSISSAQLSAWLDSCSKAGASPRFVRNIASYTRQFFRFAQDKRFVVSNPAANLVKDTPLEDERDIVILTIDQTKALLKTAMTEEYRELLPSLVLGLFCGGIRTEELSRLNWSDVNLAERRVKLSGKQTKTREKRVCEIPAGALQFLLLHPNRQGPVAPQGFEYSLTDFYKAAGFKRWKRDFANAKRHSFGTYASKLHDWAWVVDEMGNSVSMLLKHYRDASVTKEDAEAYFAITPKNLDTVADVTPIAKGA